MYELSDIVYVYFGNLKFTLPYVGLNFNRLGTIVNIEEVNKDMYHYTIKCLEYELQVKSYDNSFNICNIEELIEYIHESDCEKEKSVKLLEELNDYIIKLEN